MSQQLAGLAKALDEIALEDVHELRHEMRRQLADAELESAYLDARLQIADLAARARAIAAALDDVISEVDDLRSAWLLTRRYTPDGVAALIRDLADRTLLSPDSPADPWIKEILTALVGGEHIAAATLARSLPGELEERDREAVVDGLERWEDGNLEAGLELMLELAQGRLRTSFALTDATRATAHRLAGWLCRSLGRGSAEVWFHLDDALKLDPWNGRALAERGALHLLEGDADRAAREAQRAVEMQPDRPMGYLVLGVCAEWAGQYGQADRLYDDGVGRLPGLDIAPALRRLNGLEPTGRMLLRAAERLLLNDCYQRALEFADEAVQRGVADARQWPLADAHRLRSVALERLGAGHDAAEAALEAGKQLMWSGEYVSAIDQLTRALALDESLTATRWYLVEARTASSSPGDRAEPDYAALAQARADWDEAVRRLGEPAPEYAWAYVTRGLIAEWESWQPGVDREAATWERLALIERSLVLDRSLSRTWAASAASLRGLGFIALPLESIQQVIELGGVDDWAESERIAILAERGDFEEAFEAAVTYGERYADDPYIHWAKAWLAYRLGRPEDALTYLRLPLSHEYDIARYLSLSALCHVKLGDLEAARRDYATTLERGRAVGSGKVLLMLACSAIGDQDGMRHWLDEVEADPSINQADVEEARAQMELHNGDLDAAISHLHIAIRSIRNERELVDFVDHLETRLRVLPGDEADVEHIRNVIDEGIRDVAAVQLEAIREAPPTGDSELTGALEQRASSPITESAVTALTAVRARRLWQQGAHFESAGDYERLLETSFAPEARRALRETLLAAIDARTKVGDVAGVQELQARLEDHQLTSEVETATAMANVLVTAGRVPEAVSVLDSSLRPRDGIVATARLTLFDRLGMLALLRDDLGEAERQFKQGQELAAASADPVGEARFATHLAVSAALSGDGARVLEPLESALDAWTRAGAYQADNSLRQELRTVLESSELAGKALKPASELLAAAVRRLEDAGRVSTDVAGHLTDELMKAAPRP